MHTRIDSWFGITERGSDYGRELRGGVVTFVAMAYIIVLNPLILGTVRDVNGNLIGGAADERVAIAMVTAGTALVAGLMTIAMVSSAASRSGSRPASASTAIWPSPSPRR